MFETATKKTAHETQNIPLQKLTEVILESLFLLDDTKENLSKVRDEKSLLEKQQGDLFIEEKKFFDSKNSQSKNNNPIIDYLDFEDGYEKALASVFSDVIDKYARKSNY